MQQLIDRVHKAARRYSVLDFGVLKICMFAIGLWTGIKYARPLRSKLRLVQAVSFLSFVYILYSTFRKICGEEKERNED